MRNPFSRDGANIRASLLAVVVALQGVLILFNTLLGQFSIYHFVRHKIVVPSGSFLIDLPLLLALALLYLSFFLRKRKVTAWNFAVGIYVVLFIFDLLTFRKHPGTHFVMLLLPLVMMIVLWAMRKDFVVRSDVRAFAVSLRVSALVLVVAFLYGTLGFELMDNLDFHREISVLGAMHYTVDQFALTTDALHAYTRRAVLFQDSLTFISVSAVGFALISLFQPLRARYSHQKEWHEQARQLIYSSSQDSEDFFKLWPHDKTYFFSATGRSGVAYKVQRGVALVVGDPFGETKEYKKLLGEFEDFCFGNDWRPAFIHTTVRSKKMFAARGYHQQVIGEEALVDIAHFVTEVSQQKYFREIQKRFTKLGYTFEVLQPPHHAAIIDRVKTISDEWLQRPGREERRFMMGFFSEEYIQQGLLAIARDAAGTIQAYMNLLPSPLPEEADYDMLRSAKHAAGNINDYVLMGVMTHLYNEGTAKHVNMGLCPLAGLEDEPSTLINRTLRFVYSNGDRFYSFRGLYKFKAKYEPVWHDRYIVYRGNAADFTRVMTALNKAMKF